MSLLLHSSCSTFTVSGSFSLSLSHPPSLGKREAVLHTRAIAAVAVVMFRCLEWIHRAKILSYYIFILLHDCLLLPAVDNWITALVL